MIISNLHTDAVNRARQALQLKADYQSLAIAERLKAGKGGSVTSLDGGKLIYAEPNGMVNIAIGVGMEPEVSASGYTTEAELVSAITQFYHERNSSVKLETSMLARPQFLTAVFLAGYQLIEVNNIYYRAANDVQQLPITPPSHPLGASYEVFEVGPDYTGFSDMVRVILEGYSIEPSDQFMAFFQDWLDLPGQRKWVIRHGSSIVGGFSLLVMDKRAYFSGASIHEHHRGQGLHHQAMQIRLAAVATIPEVQDLYFTASHASVSALHAETYGFRQVDTRLAWRLAGPERV